LFEVNQPQLLGRSEAEGGDVKCICFYVLKCVHFWTKRKFILSLRQSIPERERERDRGRERERYGDRQRDREREWIPNALCPASNLSAALATVVPSTVNKISGAGLFWFLMFIEYKRKQKIILEFYLLYCYIWNSCQG
jgi:hypothetical protein